MKSARWTFGLVVVLAFLAAAFLTTAANSQFPTTCNSWNNSSARFMAGYGGYCGGTGGFCAECSTGWATGYSVCVSDSAGIGYCTDYQY